MCIPRVEGRGPPGRADACNYGCHFNNVDELGDE